MDPTPPIFASSNTMKESDETEPKQNQNNRESNSDESFTRSARQKDRAKHSESENRRRTRLRHMFAMLRDVCECTRKDRFTILYSAVQQLEEYKKRTRDQELESSSRSVNQASQSTDRDMNIDSSISSVYFKIANLSPASITTPLDSYSLLSQFNVALISIDGRIIDSNSRFLDTFGYSKSELAALTVFSISPLTGSMSQSIQLLVSGELSSCECQRVCFNKEGTRLNMRMILAGVLVDGKIEYMLCILVPIIENKTIISEPSSAPLITPQPLYEQIWMPSEIPIPKVADPTSSVMVEPGMSPAGLPFVSYYDTQNNSVESAASEFPRTNSGVPLYSQSVEYFRPPSGNINFEYPRELSATALPVASYSQEYTSSAPQWTVSPSPNWIKMEPGPLTTDKEIASQIGYSAPAFVHQNMTVPQYQNLVTYPYPQGIQTLTPPQPRFRTVLSYPALSHSAPNTPIKTPSVTSFRPIVEKSPYVHPQESRRYNHSNLQPPHNKR